MKHFWGDSFKMRSIYFKHSYFKLQIVLNFKQNFLLSLPH